MPKPFFIPIPKATKLAACRSCKQEIFWAPHPTSGNNHPVSVAPADCFPPTKDADGQGVSHFSDCAFAKEHRKRQ